MPPSGSVPSLADSLRELARVSDDLLIERLKSTVSSERKVMVAVLVLLIEVERRGLHRERYSSLFTYCTDRLLYSRSAAGRRIAAARCLRDHPRVMEMLLNGRLNLTTLCLVARVIRTDNADEVLARAAGCNQAEAEELAAAYGAPARRRERIRPVRAPRNAGGSGTEGHARQTAAGGCDSSGGAGGEVDGDAGAPHGADRQPGGPTWGAGSPRGDAWIRPDDTGRSPGDQARGAREPAESTGGPGKQEHPVDPHSDRRGAGGQLSSESTAGVPPAENATGDGRNREDLKFDITFRVDRAFMDRLERARILLSRGRPDLSLADVFEQALNTYLEKCDPVRREARRHARMEARATRNRVRPRTRAGSRRPGGMATADEETRTQSSRHIPARVRDQVMERDGMQCTFVGPEGRCPATHGLQVDHIHPHALGGSPKLSNLRMRCASHNQLAAEDVFGTVFMRRHRGVPTRERRRTATPAPGQDQTR